jgi:hypothetical protein
MTSTIISAENWYIEPILLTKDISMNDVSGIDLSMNDVSGIDLSMNDVSGIDLSMNDVSGINLPIKKYISMWVRHSTHLELQRNPAFVKAKLFTGNTDKDLVKTFVKKIDIDITISPENYVYYEYNFHNLKNIKPYRDMNGWKGDFICEKKRYTLLMCFNMRKQIKNYPSQSESELEERFMNWNNI